MVEELGQQGKGCAQAGEDKDCTEVQLRAHSAYKYGAYSRAKPQNSKGETGIKDGAVGICDGLDEARGYGGEDGGGALDDGDEKKGRKEALGGEDLPGLGEEGKGRAALIIGPLEGLFDENQYGETRSEYETGGDKVSGPESEGLGKLTADKGRDCNGKIASELEEANHEGKAVAGDEGAGKGHSRANAAGDAAVEDADADELWDVGDEAGEHQDECPGHVGAHQHGLSAVGVGEVAPEGSGYAHEQGKNTGGGTGPEGCICNGIYTQLLFDEDGVERLHEGPADGCHPLGKANEGHLPFPVFHASEAEEGDEGGSGEGAHYAGPGGPASGSEGLIPESCKSPGTSRSHPKGMMWMPRVSGTTSEMIREAMSIPFSRLLEAASISSMRCWGTTMPGTLLLR